MRSAALRPRRTWCDLGRELGLALVAASLAISACSIYQPELLDDAAAVTTSGAGNTGSSGGSGGASKPGGGAGKASGGDGMLSGEGGEPQDSGDAGADAGGNGSAAGASSEPQGGTSTGGGGSSGSGGGPVGGPDPLLDGFEDDDLTLEPNDGRSGVWYLFDDGTTGKVGPSPLACAPLSEAPTELGGFAMRVTATGFTVWGSGLGVDFRAGKKPYDGSKYTGIRFWAKVGEAKNTRHRLQLVDATTDKLGGKCNPAVDAVDGEKCDDHFGKNLVLTSTWTLYEVPFADLAQVGFGLPAPALDTAALYGLQLTAKAKLDVDLWLDQVEFF